MKGEEIYLLQEQDPESRTSISQSVTTIIKRHSGRQESEGEGRVTSEVSEAEAGPDTARRATEEAEAGAGDTEAEAHSEDPAQVETVGAASSLQLRCSCFPYLNIFKLKK